MTIQLSDCCKATIDLDKTKKRPECYTCSKCGRIIGSPLPQPTMKQIPNIEETHNTEVERIVEEYYMMFCHSVDTVPFHSTNTAIGELEWLRTTLTQDRQDILAVLIKQIEIKRRTGLETKARGNDDFESTSCEECGGYDECDCSGYNQALTDTLTIINSIFKE